MTSSSSTPDAVSESPSLYRALPLPPGSKCIRLLTVHAPSSRFDDHGPLEGSLFVEDLDQRPAFTALSYVWGTSSALPQTISCGESTVSITDNCHSALVHLRRKLGTFTIWVDAICIDQNNDDEKSRQIPLMEDIFSGAQSVYIWLGAGSPSTDRAMKFLSHTGLFECFFNNGCPNSGVLPQLRVWPAVWKLYAARWTLYRAAMPIVDRDSVQTWALRLYRHLMRLSITSCASHSDIKELLSSQWAGRVWTFQEVTLATRPIVLCGNAELAWPIFAAAIIFLSTMLIEHQSLTHPLSTWRKLVLSRGSVTDTNQRVTLMQYHRLAQKLLRWCTINRYIAWGVSFCLLYIFAIAPFSVYSWPSSLIIWVLLPILLSLIFLDWHLFRHSPNPVSSLCLIHFEGWVDESDDLVDAICTRTASNPRDMAFGMRSVLSKLLNTQLTAPDYTTAKGELYRELAIHVLRSTASLQFLIPASLQRLPSHDAQPCWVPDWSAEFPSYWLRPYLSFQTLKSAAPDSRPICSLGTEGRALSVHGRKICNIESILEFQASSETYDSSDLEIHLSNIRIMFTLFAFRRKNQHRSSPELSDLLLNPLNHPTFPNDIGAGNLQIYLDFLWNRRRKSPLDVLALLNKTGHFLRRGEVISRYFNRVPYKLMFYVHVSICNSMARTGRKIFLVRDLRILSTMSHWNGLLFTERPGNLLKNNSKPRTVPSIGICTGETRVGDTVAIISGLAVPLVLRRVNQDSHHLVSPAIVAGAMEGQAWAGGGRSTGIFDQEAAVNPPLEVFKLI